MGAQTFLELQQPFHSAGGAAFTTFTAYQDISPTKPLLAAEVLSQPGRKIEIEAWGEFSNTGTPTLSIGVFLGTAATVWQSTLITTTTAATAWPWHLKWQAESLGQGATNTLYGQGLLDLGTSLTALTSSWCPASAAARTVTVNTTGALYAGVGAQWGTSSASNSITTKLLNVIVMN